MIVKIAARDLVEGQMIDAEPIYRHFGENVPVWAEYEMVVLEEVLSEDIVTLCGENFSFALPRDYMVEVEDGTF